MAISFVNKSAFASGTAGLTVGAVASVQADDLILLFAESANENIATPTGFTQVTNSPVSTGTAAAIGGVRLAVFYQWATGADTTTTVADSGNHTTAIKMAFRGVDTTTPFDATPVSGIKATASTTATFPGITTTTANAWIVHASGLDLDAASTATTGAATNANLTDITERHDQTISGGVGGGLVVITGTKATAGATGNTTATVTSTIQVYLTMALREQALVELFGDGAASETGADAASGAGEVLVQGGGATAEVGGDAASASGTVSDPAIVGSGAALEAGVDAAAGAGLVLVRGSGAGTEAGADAATGAGDVFVQGAGSAAETGADAAAAAGLVLVQGAGAATEAGQDVAEGAGGLTAVVTGSGAAVESGQDTAAADGRVIVQGAGVLAEVGADAAASVGGALVSGEGSAQELGQDVAAAVGTLAIVATGSGAVVEVAQDSAAGLGAVLVSVTGAAQELSADEAASLGQVLVRGQGAVVEQGDDVALAGGGVVTVAGGYANVVEQGADTVDGYVLPGYVEPGFVAGVSGTVGTAFTITGAQALLLRRLCQLHGLLEPLLVGPTERRAGDLVQSVTEVGDAVTIATIGGHDTFQGQPGQMIEELAALHGLTAELTVTARGRQAGAVVQTFTSEGATTRVTRQ